MPILHADARLVVVDKPAGLLSVPGKASQDSVQTRLARPYPDSLLVHRLDMATSGAMVFARDRDAQRNLGLQFERRHVRKTYIADVCGKVPRGSGRIALPLRCDWERRPRQMVCWDHGKPAVTDWIGLGGRRVALHPVTGRSHQLRVHMMALGCPILGDRIYADDAGFAAAARMHLHARTLTIRCVETGAERTFESSVPF